MNTLTLKIPEALDTALRVASERRHVSKSALVRQVLEKALAQEIEQTTAAARWVSEWRGSLWGKEEAAHNEARLAHLLNKHLR